MTENFPRFIRQEPTYQSSENAKKENYTFQLGQKVQLSIPLSNKKDSKIKGKEKVF